MVTIITERYLKKDILEGIKELGAKGYTTSDVSGDGSRGIRATDFEGRNVKIETIVNKDTGNKILDFIADKYFEDYAVITYVYEVKVVRGDKYF